MNLRILVLLTALLLPATALATDEKEAETYAVQPRDFTLRHELNVQLGLLPMNAFFKGVTIGGGYTFHFTDHWAWEVVQISYVSSVDTGLQRELLQRFMVQPTQVESMEWFATTNIVAKPLYGKFALFNKLVIRSEVFFNLGAGLGKFMNPSVFRFAPDAGVGLRVFLLRYLSVRLDARDFVYFKGTGVQNELFIGLSLALASPRAN